MLQLSQTFLCIQTVSELRRAALAVLCAFIYICMMWHLLEVLVMLVDDMGSSHPDKTEWEASSHQHQSKSVHGHRLNGMCMFCLLLMDRHSLEMLCGSWAWDALGLSSWACQLPDQIVRDLLPSLASKVRTIVPTHFLFMLSSPALYSHFLRLFGGVSQKVQIPNCQNVFVRYRVEVVL